MAEGSERRTRKRTTTRATAEIVPTGDPERQAGPTGDAGRGPLAIIERARDTLTVKRVFGEAIERDGVTVIPAANVRGGGGGGGDVQGNGGGGFGVSASPAGAYVIKDGDVRWEPAFDRGRAILMGQVIAIVALLTIRSVLTAFAKRR